MKLQLHIGTEKTGTSSIQDLISLNETELISRGFIPIRSFGFPNAIHLTLIAASPESVLSLRGGNWGHEAREQLRTEVERACSAEISRVANKDAIYILSNEHCHSRIHTLEEVRYLKQFLSNWFDEFEIIVYLRRQDRLATSAYSSMLRAGSIRSEVINPDLQGIGYYDYNGLIDRFSETFGAENVNVRIYKEAWQSGANTIEDFMKITGMRFCLEFPDRRNRSINPTGQELLRRINSHQVSGTISRQDREKLISAIEKNFCGTGKKPNKHEAQKFLSRFSEINELVRQKHFPNQESLFDDGFSEYPETTEINYTESEVLQASIKVIRTLLTWNRRQ